MTFEKQLKLLGDDFIEAMESEKNVIYPNVYDAITKAYGMQEEIAELQLDKDEPILAFLKKFYEFFVSATKYLLFKNIFLKILFMVMVDGIFVAHRIWIGRIML